MRFNATDWLVNRYRMFSENRASRMKKIDLSGPFHWPNNKSVAVSLSYDDALASQLDNALPSLNHYGFKASFYLPTSYSLVTDRLLEWRVAASQGHELGNHSVHHSCSASLPGREWVEPQNDLDKYSIKEIADEILSANVFLETIDGKVERTFAPPCNDIYIHGESYLPLIEESFVAIKGYESVAPRFVAYLVPDGSNGNASSLIEWVASEAEKGVKILHIIFHGVGGDHLSVAKKDHDALLAYLHNNQDYYWVDSYINIMKHVNNYT